MWLLLVGVGSAYADPFNVWPERTPVGAMGLNAYIGVQPGYASAYAFLGVGEGLDLIGGYSAGIEVGEAYVGPADLYVRAFPLPTAEVAVVVHGQYTSPDDWYIGPELHAMTRPAEWLGLWLDVGWRGRERADRGYVWAGVELAASRPFVALEVDHEIRLFGPGTTTLVPSVGVWLGAEYRTGVSTGVMLDVDGGSPGYGAWLWRSLDVVRGRRSELGEYRVDEGCVER